jgi:hypothetical protein
MLMMDELFGIIFYWEWDELLYLGYYPYSSLGTAPESPGHSKPK